MAYTAWSVDRTKSKPEGTNMTPITLQDPDTTNGNRFSNNGRMRILIRGAASATGTVRVNAQTKCTHGRLHNITSAANALDAATKLVELGPFPPTVYNNSDNEVEVDFIGTLTGIKAMVVEDYDE